MSFTAYINQVKTFKVQRSSLGPLGPDWQYNWDIVKLSDPLDKNFYTIQGILKEDEVNNWSYDPFISVVFLETTDPGDKFRVMANVKVITNGVEVCEPIIVADVIVEDNSDEFDCGFTQPAGCVKSGELVTYNFSCSDAGLIPDYIDFYVSSGTIFSNGQYVSNLSISPNLVGNSYQSHLQIRWNEIPTTSDGFSVYAIPRKGFLTSETISLNNLYVLPSIINLSISGLDTIQYNTGLKEYILNVTNLLRYPSGYNLKIFSQTVEGYSQEIGYVDENFVQIYDESIVSDSITDSIFLNSGNFDPSTSTITIILKIVITNGTCEVENIFYKGISVVGCIDNIYAGDIEFSVETCPTTISTDTIFEVEYDTQINDLEPCYCETTEICSLSPCYCETTEICSLSPCYCETTELCSLNPCFVYCNETELCSLNPCYCETTEICSLSPCYCETTELCSLNPCYCETTEICSLSFCTISSAVLSAGPIREIEASILPGPISPANESKIETLLLNNFYLL